MPTSSEEHGLERAPDFRTLMETVPEMVTRHRPDGTYIYVSPASKSLFGYTPEELIGRKARDFIHPEDLPTVAASAQHALEAGVQEIGEYRHLTSNGSYIWVETTAHVIAGSRKEGPNDLICVVRDITRRKLVEDALRESEDRYRALVTSSMDAVLLTKPDGQILCANDAACRMLGYSENELVRIGRRGVVDETDPRLEPALNERAHTGRFRGALTFIRKDGSTFDGEISSAVFTGRHGEHYTSMVIRDISDRKRADEALRRSEEKHRAVVEDQTEMICRFRPDGTFTFANSVYCRFFGKQPDELLGQKWMPVAVPEDVPHIEAQLQMLSASNPVVVIENRVYSAAGNVYWMQFVNRGFFDAEGRLNEIQSVGRDITARKGTDAALQEHRQQLQALAYQLTESEDRERRRIAAYLHDQVGQSLAAVRVKFAAWKRGRSPSMRRTLLADIERLIDQTIDNTRLLTFDISPPILFELGLGPALEWLGESLFEKEGIAFQFLDDGHAGEIHEILASALYRIVRELLLNVLKHASATHVSVAVSAHDSDIRLVIKDDGVGMPRARFEQALKGIGGTYGLFSIRERLQHLSGSLLIESSPGEGTRVTVLAPGAHSE